MRRLAAIVVSGMLVLTLASCSAESTSSSSASDRIDVGRSITYSEVDGDSLDLDACIPGDRSQGPFSAVVLIHGGAFREGDRASMTPLCERLAQEGQAAFAIDYRLLPASYPSQVEDAVAAVEWLRQSAQTERFDIDPNAVSLLGSSAGAIIALSAADRLGDEGNPAASVIALSAAGDLTPAARGLGSPDPRLEEVVLAYVGCATVDSCPAARDASPVYHVENLPATLLVHGSDELIPLAQADALEAAIAAAGGSVQLEVVDGEEHGMQLLNPAIRQSIARFLNANSSP